MSTRPVPPPRGHFLIFALPVVLALGAVVVMAHVGPNTRDGFGSIFLAMGILAFVICTGALISNRLYRLQMARHAMRVARERRR
jgi:tellurite resistance protein TehA-like permease